jgi:hypothetical protein
LGGSQFKVKLGKKGSEIPISINKPGIEAHTYHPSYLGGMGRRMVVRGKPKPEHKTVSKK